jgi:hypothetical protein
VVVEAWVGDVSDRRKCKEDQSAVLREALLARADAEAAQVRAEDVRLEAEEARAEADRARQEAELGRERIWLLAEAGRRMAESIDWEATLDAVVSAVPDLADWASLSIVEGGRLRVVAVAHSDPERELAAWELARRHPRDIDRPRGAAAVIRTGQVELVEDLSPEVTTALRNLEARHRLLRRARHEWLLRGEAAAGLRELTRQAGLRK